MKQGIILVGFMGTGKTSVGKILAKRLGMRFIDMDDLIVERAGKSIPEIFEQDGESVFREWERNVVLDLEGCHDFIVATGGGVVLNPDNVRDLSRHGFLVCLTATPKTILERLRNDTGRPLLAKGDKEDRIRSLLATRQHLYNAIPRCIKTDGLSAHAVADQIQASYEHKHS